MSFSWNFGSGANNSAEEDPGDIQFNTPGTYTVRLIATDDFDLSDSSPDTRVITVAPKEDINDPSPAPPASTSPASPSLDIPSANNDNSICFISVHDKN